MELAFILTVLGMVTVMIVLYLINLMIRGMGILFAAKTVPALPETPDVAVSSEESDPGELVAVISAAVSAYLDTRSSSLVVRPFARPESAWAAASRAENTQK